MEDGRAVVVGRPWRPLVRLAAGAAGLVVVLIPVQAAVFLLHPPPDTAAEYFALFERNPLLGLVSLDLLLTVDYLAMIPFYLALYVLLRRESPAWALVGLVTGLLSLTLYLVSREATFAMWQLSGQFRSATDEADRAVYRAAGQAFLTLYDGGTFGVSYVLGAASTLVFSVVMLRRRVFGTLPGIVGLVTGATMLVPPNVGPAGVALAMASLVPTLVWLVVLCHAFLVRVRYEPDRTAVAPPPVRGGTLPR